MRSMRTRGLALVFVASSVLIGVIGGLPSCDGPPSKTCFADRVNALGVTEDSGPNRACSTCLQTKNAPKACCDAVGACDEDPEKKCADGFKAAHLCVLEGGTSQSNEQRCKELLTNDRSKTLYACMRSNCAEECGGVPNCDLDPGVELFANPSCDTCVNDACCEKRNACHQNRSCRLVVQCITTRCPRTLGTAMNALSGLPDEIYRAVNDAVCSGKPLDTGADTGAATACIQRCLNDRPADSEGGSTALCLAVGVFACGSQAGCASRCGPDSGTYSNEGEWPEDNPDALLRDAAPE
jgi:hypothetical protein